MTPQGTPSRDREPDPVPLVVELGGGWDGRSLR